MATLQRDSMGLLGQLAVMVVLCASPALAARPVQQPQPLLSAGSPSFCHDLECPRFVVADSPLTGDTELREYEGGEL
jgi:hypothetical protein